MVRPPGRIASREAQQTAAEDIEQRLPRKVAQHGARQLQGGLDPGLAPGARCRAGRERQGVPVEDRAEQRHVRLQRARDDGDAIERDPLVAVPRQDVERDFPELRLRPLGVEESDARLARGTDQSKSSPAALSGAIIAAISRRHVRLIGSRTTNEKSKASQ